MSGEGLTGPLAGTRVVELSSELGAWAGKLLGDMGADVILVEPPGGDDTRRFGPFVDDVPDAERSLWFWHYNTSKRGMTLDLDDADGRDLFKQLVAGADFLLEAQCPGRLARLGLDYPNLRSLNDGLIMLSISPYGQQGPRAQDAAVDLTLLAGGGPVWSCGYDDHTLPPVRGGGNHGYQTACHFAVMSGLAALVHRDLTGSGQHIDINAHAAANVTTEAATYQWLIAGATMQRQTGRHAAAIPTQATQVLCADGRYATTGLGVRKQSDFVVLHDWLSSAGLLETFPSRPLLEWAIEEPITDMLSDDDATLEKRAAAREAVMHLAAHMSAHEFMIGGQERDMQVSVIYSPEEVLGDPHMVARGFPVRVPHPEIGREVTYPGAPILFHRSPMRIQCRAPSLGEHNADVLAELASNGFARLANSPGGRTDA
jgi:crotonobetainyl-CoA:carnitine CoA-transferase CaiB-like acyl-CoA transferase